MAESGPFLRAGLVQMRSGTDPARNLDEAERLIRTAAGDGAQLIATPECTNLVQRDKAALATTLKLEAEDPAPARFSALARELGVHLLAGSFVLRREDGRAANRAMLFAPDGAVAARYDKIHMFDVTLGGGEDWKESATYTPGDRAVVAPTPWGGLGLSICYDLRFAALYRRLAQAGATLIAVPAAFTRPTGEAHWSVLIRARAIETGCFVLAPAQGGRHEDGRGTWGHSMVAGPWGEVVAELAGDAPDVLMAELDLSAVHAARSKIPQLQHDREFTLS
jgi:predicted amidohydrolase